MAKLKKSAAKTATGKTGKAKSTGTRKSHAAHPTKSLTESAQQI